MNFYRKFILIKILLVVLLSGCTRTKPITKDQLAEVLDRPFITWTLDECDEIIKVSTITNGTGMYANQVYDNVYIKATILDRISITAITRREAILQRLTLEDFVKRLTYYHEEFTNYSVESSTAAIIKKNVEEDSLKGLSFQITFQNVSSPYSMIDVEDGYSYFFLESANLPYQNIPVDHVVWQHAGQVSSYS